MSLLHQDQATPSVEVLHKSRSPKVVNLNVEDVNPKIVGKLSSPQNGWWK